MTEGRLCGRTDVAADITDLAQITTLRAALGLPGRLITSPALRCRQTAEALWSGHPSTTEADLWEQDFGQWEEPGTVIPDLGPLPVAELAAHRPPGGESFLDMAARVRPLLTKAQGTTAIIAHAGTARAALAMVIGPAALSFSIAPLSLTILTRTPGGWAVEAVNRVAP